MQLISQVKRVAKQLKHRYFSKYAFRRYRSLSNQLVERFAFLDSDIDAYESVADGLNKRLGLFPLSKMLPYRQYCTAKNIYYNTNGIGLLYECRPLVGASSKEVGALIKILDKPFDSYIIQLE